MTEQEFEAFLYGVVETAPAWETYDDEGHHKGGVTMLATFEALGLMTGNAGLVVRLDDGSEFQVTIVRSR